MAALLFGVAGCASSTEPQVTIWVGEFVPGLEHPVTGSIAAVSQLNRSEISIAITVAEPDSSYAWDVRRGDCSEQGAILAGPAVYPVLVPDADGNAGAETAISEVMHANESYSARVRFENAATIVACTEFEQTSG